jgi:predicted RNA binding protein YcfA (HicA-like mRNA interferase family)
MLYMLAMTGKQLKKILEANGWLLDRISGSHHIMVCEGCRSIPVPVHGSQGLPRGLVHAVLKQAEVKE